MRLADLANDHHLRDDAVLRACAKNVADDVEFHIRLGDGIFDIEVFATYRSPMLAKPVHAVSMVNEFRVRNDGDLAFAVRDARREAVAKINCHLGAL